MLLYKKVIAMSKMSTMSNKHNDSGEDSQNYTQEQLEKMTVKDLIKICKKKDLGGYSGKLKENVINLILGKPLKIKTYTLIQQELTCRKKLLQKNMRELQYICKQCNIKPSNKRKPTLVECIIQKNTKCLLDTIPPELQNMIYEFEKQMRLGSIFNELDECIEDYKKTHSNLLKFQKEITESSSFWRHISGKGVSIEFVEHFQDRVHWDLISRYTTFKIKDIEKFDKKLHWCWVQWNECLTEDIFLQFKDKWEMWYIGASLQKKLGEEFFIKNREKCSFDWEQITNNCYEFSNKFFAECCDHLYWSKISREKTNITETFLDDFKDYIDFCDLIEYNETKFQVECLRKYKSNIKKQIPKFIYRFEYDVANEGLTPAQDDCYEMLQEIFQDDTDIDW